MRAPSDRSKNRTPLGFLLAVMRDPAQPIALRMRAAIAALPYTAAKKRAGTKDTSAPTLTSSGVPEQRNKVTRRLHLVKKPGLKEKNG